MHTNLIREGFLAYLERLPSAAHSSADTLSQGSIFHSNEPYGAGSCNSTDLYIDYIYLPTCMAFGRTSMRPVRMADQGPRTNAFRFRGEDVHPDPSEIEPQAPSTLDRPDLLTPLGNLSDAIAVVTVAHRSLEAKEIAEAGDEEVALRYAISLLRAAYTELDIASLHSSE